ncbi:unnamed protein product [Prorocentrum cordatum]|uniref:Uncharacterized protein n=1 Tax=Prorocentrum cordatum TaxID=2364126 RepID=A0ABN9TLT6_9DINO|nr:unnamed protein product [Polarella glacialis]
MQGQLPGQQAPGQQMQPGMPGQMGWGGMQPGMQGVQGTQPGVQQGGTHQQVAYNAMAQQMPGQQMPGSGDKDQEEQSGAPQGATGSSSFTEAQALELRSILREEIMAVITASSSPGQASEGAAHQAREGASGSDPWEDLGSDPWQDGRKRGTGENDNVRWGGRGWWSASADAQWDSRTGADLSQAKWSGNGGWTADAQKWSAVDWRSSSGGHEDSTAWPSSSWWEKPDLGDPDPWLGWSEHRLWRRGVRRWLAGAGVAVSRRADRILKVLDIELRKKFEDISDTTVVSDAGPQAILDRLDVLSGQRQDDEMRRVGRECLFGFQRRQGGSLSIYAARMDQVFDRLSSQGLDLNSKWRHFFLEEGVGVDDSQKQMLKVLSKNTGEYQDLLKAIREMDMQRNESLTHGKKTFAEFEQSSQSTFHDEQTVLVTIDQADISELDVPTILAELASERRKSWKENKDYKRRLKVGRKCFPTPPPAGFFVRTNDCTASSGLVLMTALGQDPLGALIEKGVGGRTNVSTGLLVPTGIEGRRGAMQLDLISEEVPALMPIGMQEALGAIKDLPEEKATFKNLDTTTPLKWLSSGHRTIRIDKLGLPDDFHVPESVSSKSGVSKQDFVRQPGPRCKMSACHSADDVGPTAMGGQSRGLGEGRSRVQGPSRGRPGPFRFAQASMPIRFVIPFRVLHGVSWKIPRTTGMTDQRYALTVRDVPEEMQLEHLRWVHIVSQSLRVEEALGLSILDMSRAGRLWPVAFARRQRRLTVEMLQCRHNPLRRRVGANASATWIKCVDCDMRLAYWNRPKIEVQPQLLTIKGEPGYSTEPGSGLSGGPAVPNIRRYNKGQDDKKELLSKLVKVDHSKSPAAVKGQMRSGAATRPSYVPMQVGELAHAERKSRPRTSESSFAKDMKELKDAIQQQNESLQQRGQALQFLLQPHVVQLQQQHAAAITTAVPGTPRQTDKWEVIGQSSPQSPEAAAAAAASPSLT